MSDSMLTLLCHACLKSNMGKVPICLGLILFMLRPSFTMSLLLSLFACNFGVYLLQISYNLGPIFLINYTEDYINYYLPTFLLNA